MLQPARMQRANRQCFRCAFEINLFQAQSDSSVSTSQESFAKASEATGTASCSLPEKKSRKSCAWLKPTKLSAHLSLDLHRGGCIRSKIESREDISNHMFEFLVIQGDATCCRFGPQCRSFMFPKTFRIASRILLCHELISLRTPGRMLK